MSDNRGKKVLDFNKAKKAVEEQISAGQKEGNVQGTLYSMRKPDDPNMTIDLNNDALEELIEQYAKEQNADNLNTLVRKIHDSRVLVPADVNKEGKPIPCFINSPEKGTYLPLYTSKKHIPAEPKSPAIMNIPYMAANALGVKEERVEGIVINPFTNNLVFKNNLLNRIDSIEKALKEGPKVKKIELTQEQYELFERHQYEVMFLPKKLFEEGEAFITELCEKKEEFLDQLYEESYQQKRLYPYLPEEFSVMPMDISDELLLVRIDFPGKKIDTGCCQRAYVAWNKNEKIAKYYMIQSMGKSAPMILAEVNAERKHINHGEAPIEGAELQMIIDLANGEVEQTN